MERHADRQSKVLARLILPNLNLLRANFEHAFALLEQAHQADLSSQPWMYAVERAMIILSQVTKRMAVDYVTQKRGVEVHSIGEVGKALKNYQLISETEAETWIGLVSIGEQLNAIGRPPGESVIKAVVGVSKYKVFSKVFNALSPLPPST